MEKKRPYKNKVSFLLSEGGKERQLGWIGACCRLEKRGTWQVTPELCSAAETGGSGQEHGYCFRPRWWCGPLRRGFLPSTVDSPCSGILFFSLASVIFSGHLRWHKEKQMMLTTQFICGISGSFSRTMLFLQRREHFLPSKMPACSLEPFIAKARKRESQLAGASPQASSGKMDVNRNAWMSECVFCCEKVQVEPWSIDFIKITF